VQYDGHRPGQKDREYVIIMDTIPGAATWGGKPYGLQRERDSYHFEPSSPEKGEIADLFVSRETWRRLTRQRQLRASSRKPKRRRKAPWIR